MQWIVQILAMLATGLVVCAAPAEAQMQPTMAELNCIIDTIPADDMERSIAQDDPSFALPDGRLQVLRANCATQYGWTEERGEHMTSLFMAQMMERVARHYSGFSPAQLQRIDRAYEQADQDRMREFAVPIVRYFIENRFRFPRMTPEQSRFFGSLATRAGISNEGSAGIRVDPIVIFRLIRETVTAMLQEQETAAAGAATETAVDAPPIRSAEQITCGIDRLSPTQREQVGSNLINGGDAEGAAMDALREAIAYCADEYDWSPEAIEDATYFSITSLMEVHLLSQFPFTEAEMARLRRAIASVDQAALARAMDPMIEAGLGGGNPPPISPEAQRLLVQIVIRSGVSMTEEEAEFSGRLIGAIAFAARMRRAFVGH